MIYRKFDVVFIGELEREVDDFIKLKGFFIVILIMV